MEKDVKAWEHSLRSGLYDGRQANRARPGLNIKPINSRRSLTHRDSVNVLHHSENSESPSTYSPVICSPKREPQNSLSSPTILSAHNQLQKPREKTCHSQKVINVTFTRSPNMEKEADSSAEDSPRSDNVSFNTSYLNMIKKRQALLYSNSQHQDLPCVNAENDVAARGSVSQSVDPGDIINSPVARFSRHITEQARSSGSLSQSQTGDIRLSSHVISKIEQNGRQAATDFTNSSNSTFSFDGRRENPKMLTIPHSPDVGECSSTIIKVQDLDRHPVTPQAINMNVSRQHTSSMWSRPTNRAVISETWTPARNRAMIVDDEEQDEYRSMMRTHRPSMSFARSYTKKLHHGMDNWDNWDVGPTRKISTVQERAGDQDFLEELLPEVSGPKKKGKVKNIRAQMNCCSLLWHDFKLWRRRRRYQKESNPVFQKQIKIVESQFGSGTVSFFIFVRWLLLLNMLLCGVWTVTVVLPQAVFYTGYSDMLNNFYFTNLIDGKNAFSKSFMFYGGYEATLGAYPLALVYLCSVLVTYFGSLFVIFNGIARSLEAGGSLKDTRYTYFNLVLTGWDYSLMQHEAAVNMASGLTNTFKDLISEAHSRAKKDISRNEHIKLYLKRAVAWIITVILIGGGCTAIFFMISTDMAELFTSMGHQVTDDDILVVYTPSLAFMAINSLVPLCIYKLPLLENYTSGKVELNVSTMRVFVLRMANILALVVSLYNKQQSQTACVGTYLGQELYKLVVLDTLVQVFSTLVPNFVHYYWTNKKKEFKMPQRILVLVYRQALIWLGTLVCPVMPLVGVVSTTIFFAVNYLMVTVTCKPPVKRWNQARRNTLFLGLTAATLMVLIGPVSVVITRNDTIRLWVQTSSAALEANSTTTVCGPFGNNTLISAFTITQDLLENVEPISASILKVITSETVLLPLIFIIIAVAYFQDIRISWQKSKMRSIYSELVTEREQNIDLMKRTKILSEGPMTYA